VLSLLTVSALVACLPNRRIRSPSQLTCLTAASRLTNSMPNQSHITTDDPSVSASWFRAPSWRLGYIAQDRTTKKTRPSHCCLGTDPIENAAFPLLRSRLGSDHIENMSCGVCLANCQHMPHCLQHARQFFTCTLVLVRTF
jgi:hypothetical protein